jgi:hypothetical protein
MARGRSNPELRGAISLSIQPRLWHIRIQLKRATDDVGQFIRAQCLKSPRLNRPANDPRLSQSAFVAIIPKHYMPSLTMSCTTNKKRKHVTTSPDQKLPPLRNAVIFPMDVKPMQVGITPTHGNLNGVMEVGNAVVASQSNRRQIIGLMSRRRTLNW